MSDWYADDDLRKMNNFSIFGMAPNTPHDKTQDSKRKFGASNTTKLCNDDFRKYENNYSENTIPILDDSRTTNNLTKETQSQNYKPIALNNMEPFVSSRALGKSDSLANIIYNKPKGQSIEPGLSLKKKYENSEINQNRSNTLQEENHDTSFSFSNLVGKSISNVWTNAAHMTTYAKKILLDKNIGNKEKLERKSGNYSANRNVSVEDDDDEDDDFTQSYTKRGTRNSTSKYKKEPEPLFLVPPIRRSTRKAKRPSASECIDLISDSDDDIEFELSDHDSYSHPPQNQIVISQKQFIESVREYIPKKNRPRSEVLPWQESKIYAKSIFYEDKHYFPIKRNCLIHFHEDRLYFCILEDFSSPEEDHFTDILDLGSKPYILLSSLSEVSYSAGLGNNYISLQLKKTRQISHFITYVPYEYIDMKTMPKHMLIVTDSSNQNHFINAINTYNLDKRESNSYIECIEATSKDQNTFIDVVLSSSNCDKLQAQIIFKQSKQDQLNAANEYLFNSKNSNRRSRRRVAYHEPPPDPTDPVIILFYPMDESAQDVISITNGDVKRLEPFVYLNDNIIDFKIKYLMKNLCDSNPEKASRLHIFSSLFYSKLTELSEYESYQLVKRWTKNVDIFEKDFLIIPINESNHWSLTIIVRPGLLMKSPAVKYPQQAKYIVDLDPISPENTQEEEKDEVDLTNYPCILFLDSLRLHNQTKISTRLRSYLTFEWIDKKKVLADGENLPDPTINPRFYLKMLPFKEVKSFPSVDCGRSIPLQTNGYDCGVYVIKYFEHFLIRNDIPSSKSLIDSKYSNHFGINEFTSDDINEERENLKQIISRLSQEWRVLDSERNQKLKQEKEKAKLEKREDKHSAQDAGGI